MDPVFICTLYDTLSGNSMCLGVFSTHANAESAAKNTMREIRGFDPELLDWDSDVTDGGITYHYFYETYTISITSAHVDKPL